MKPLSDEKSSNILVMFIWYHHCMFTTDSKTFFTYIFRIQNVEILVFKIPKYKYLFLPLIIFIFLHFWIILHAQATC